MKQRRARAGFTLVELLVVVGITVLLAAFVITYNTTGRQQIALQVEQSQLTQTVLRAKSLAVATFKAPSEAIVPCGYGVHFDYTSQSYTLFSYDDEDVCDIVSIIPGFRKELNTFKVNPTLRIAAGLGRLDDVLFLPPDPITLINNDGVVVAGGTGVVRLETRDGSATREIRITVGGQVSFK